SAALDSRNVWLARPKASLASAPAAERPHEVRERQTTAAFTWHRRQSEIGRESVADESDASADHTIHAVAERQPVLCHQLDASRDPTLAANQDDGFVGDV